MWAHRLKWNVCTEFKYVNRSRALARRPIAFIFTNTISCRKVDLGVFVLFPRLFVLLILTLSHSFENPQSYVVLKGARQFDRNARAINLPNHFASP